MSISHGWAALVLLAACAAGLPGRAASEEAPVDNRRVQWLANDFVEVYRSPAPQRAALYTPGLALTPSGRLVATFDAEGAEESVLPPPKAGSGTSMVYTSDDRGRTWTYRVNFPFLHARPFAAGGSIYVLGHRGRLMIIRSDDEGETWTEPVYLTDTGGWHQSACNVLYHQGKVYLVMERNMGGAMEKGWAVSQLAPILMRAPADADLTQRESWTFASPLPFREAVDDQALDYFGVPFFPAFYPERKLIAPRRDMNPIGWLETNVVRITDPDHYWFDPEGRTFHLWMRAHTGGTGYAAICKAVEEADGTITTMLETVPSGKRVVFVPCPGGQMRFHVLHDRESGLYWLLSTQATDSMRRAHALPEGRFNLPNNERRRLQLHFSTNMIDWCFAGLVAEGPADHAARHYASMVIDGEDLHILSRSGDLDAQSAHNGNIITFHTIPKFRNLAY